ncbi:MAG: ATP-binding protein [Fibrobacterales bacterium]
MKAYIISKNEFISSFFGNYLEENGYSLHSHVSILDAWQDIRLDTETPIIFIQYQKDNEENDSFVQRIRKFDALQDRHSFLIYLYSTTRHKMDNSLKASKSTIDMHLTSPSVSLTDQFETIQMFTALMRIVHYEQKVKKQTTELFEYAEKMEHLAQQRAEQLIHADRMVTLGTMSAGIAHEINNPTSFISGNIQTIERGWNMIQDTLKENHVLQDNERLTLITNEFPNMIQGVKKGVERITNIVKGLKLYSRQEKSSKQSLNLITCINDALEMCRAIAKKVTIQTNYAHETLYVNADRTQLSQVIVNLITNAADALAQSSSPLIVIDVSCDTTTIEITCRDNGPGISDAVLQKLFNPFFTTKDKSTGTGLGLSISKGIIEDHGGIIRATSTENSGACFIITLPVSQAPLNEETPK